MSNYRHNFSDVSDETASGGPETLAMRVYSALHDEILAGTMPPGTRLVRRTLSKRLGVSPIPVAKALLRLEIDGLVESRPLYGSRVRCLTIEDVREDTVLREAIECQSVRLCTRSATKSQLAELMSDAKQVDRLMSQGDPRSKLGMRAHLDLHLSIARCCGFKRLSQELERVWFRRAMRLNWVKATRCRPVPEHWHELLIDTICNGDPDEAEAAMRKHVHYGSEEDAAALEYVAQESSSDE